MVPSNQARPPQSTSGATAAQRARHTQHSDTQKPL